jgi:ferredoxin-NADP reductase
MVLPLRPQKLRFTVLQRTALSPSVFSLVLEPEKPFSFTPGQWLSVILPGTSPEIRRAYSIASPPGAHLELCIQKIPQGLGSEFLGGLQVGDGFLAEGPFGNFIFHPKPGRGACFIATGTGIAPFRSILLTPKLTDSAEFQWCLLGVRTTHEVLFDHDLSGVSGLEWRVCLSQQTAEKGHQFSGRVTTWMEQIGSRSIPLENTDFYLCGNSAMIQQMKAMLKARGVEKSSIYQEVFFKTAMNP